MSYYIDNDECQLSYSLEDRRMPSYSLYIPRNNKYENSDNLSDCFESPKNNDSNRSSTSSFINESERVSLKKDEVCEQSLPGSTDVDSEDGEFDSHFDAIDELSELFESAPVNQEKPKRCMEFTRPSNPIIKDSQFCIPRCSAPAPVMAEVNERSLEGSEMNFSCSFGSIKRELKMNNYNNPSGSLIRPVARMNYPSISAPAPSF